MEEQPVPADEQVVGAALPKDGQLVRWLLAVSLTYLAAAALLAWLSGAQALRVLGFAVDVPMALLALAVIIRLARLRQVCRSRALRPALLAPQLAAGVALAGIPDVRVRVGTRAVGRSYRAGRHAVVLLNDGLLEQVPLATTFVVAHELGHVARHDSLRQTVVAVYLVTTLALTVWVLPPAGWAVGVLAVLGLATTYTWSRELDCDRIGSRCAGQRSAVAAIETFGRLRTANPLLRLWAQVSHPPLSLRRNAVLDPERTCGWFGPRD
ncbi:hypothetical protein KALB_1929 [Kutzneria albida DSM 43870]|uniref:Peptidase M48 domain-containing protein n=1 Tax=Kutzneria albida DSM 43870 TaxID=1449976 RepID=W5WAR4_9PSEU|nr:hypothetical protein KALB_1929 [Kutzneria albida DSM 43870]